MIRDFVTGVLMGGVVAGAGLGVASQLTQLKSEVAVVQDAPASTADQPAEVEVPKSGYSQPPAIAQADPAQPQAAAADAPGDALLRPAPVEGQPAPASISPYLPLVGDAGDAAPLAEAGPKAEPVPLPDEGEKAPNEQVAVDAGDKAKVSAEIAPDAEASAGETAVSATLEVVAPEVEAPKTSVPKAATSETVVSDSVEPESTTPETPAEPVPEGTDEAVAKATPQPDAPQPATVETETDQAPKAAAPDDLAPKAQTATLSPDTGLADKQVDGVTVGRLPVIGASDVADNPGEAATDVPATPPASLPPIQRFARAFDNPAAKPLFAILLADPGTAALNREQLAALPFPVTFVVDPMAANATEAAEVYRAAGQEVVMLATGIPKGANAADLEQSFASLTQTLPEAVALIDTADAIFQDDRGLAAEVVTLLDVQGRGLITFDRGLNAADQVARREDLPAATVFRSLDDDGEDAPLIRRYLDRAAFKAAQEGKVVVIGTARPETIAALMEWAVEGRAASVALAPITAVMAAK